MASLCHSVNHLPVYPGAQSLASANSRPLQFRKSVAYREYDIKRYYRRLYNALANTGIVEPAHGSPAQNDFDRVLLLRLLVRKPVQREVSLIADLRATMIA